MSVAFIIKAWPQAGLRKTLEKDGEEEERKKKKMELMEKKIPVVWNTYRSEKTFLRVCQDICFPFRV